jgi:N-acetyl-gamma-glutamyl-phosphate reductase
MASSLKRFKVGVIGASGYTGAELLRLIALHKNLELKVVTGHSSAGQGIRTVYPHLIQYNDATFTSYEQSTEELKACELLFLSLPHGEAAKVVMDLSGGQVLIDLSGDHRLTNPMAYEEWYGKSHPNPQSLSEWTYGIPELFRSSLQGSKRIANPGCYPTAVSLGLAPLVKAKIIDQQINAVCISGTSGAGRTSAQEFHFSHAESNIRAYKVTNHQHIPEMEQTLSKLAENTVEISFTPMVGPYTRGILATMTANLTQDINQKTLDDLYHHYYKNETFISVSNTLPELKAVRGSNCCVIHAVVDIRLNQVKILSVIDNLIKGAAGQAIQNANLVLGLPEDAYLPINGFYP